MYKTIIFSSYLLVFCYCKDVPLSVPVNAPALPYGVPGVPYGAPAVPLAPGVQYAEPALIAGASKPYKFGYTTSDDYGTTTTREEISDGNGNVKGSYSYTDAQGLTRIVEYVADEHGFRAVVKTNEPGTETSAPADALIISSAIDPNRLPPVVPIKTAPLPPLPNGPYGLPQFGGPYGLPQFGGPYGLPQYGAPYGLPGQPLPGAGIPVAPIQPLPVPGLPIAKVPVAGLKTLPAYQPYK